jgi:hypothetical protein
MKDNLEKKGGKVIKLTKRIYIKIYYEIQDTVYYKTGNIAVILPAKWFNFPTTNGDY